MIGKAELQREICDDMTVKAAAAVRPAWPDKFDIFGVGISATDYDEAVSVIMEAAHQRRSAVVSVFATHALITASQDTKLLSHVNRFEMVTPDGQPVRWALNLLHQKKLRDRVYGPTLMLRLCAQAAAEAVPIYLYGGSTVVLELLVARLASRYPNLIIAGKESPPFRPLTEAEYGQVDARMNASGAGLIFIGLGCPKQDWFAASRRDSIHAVQVCVGAAFDFHAGVKPMAPAWMQRHGLEWMFRLFSEPQRLWKRYLVTNSLYLLKLAGALCKRTQNHSGSVS